MEALSPNSLIPDSLEESRVHAFLRASKRFGVHKDGNHTPPKSGLHPCSLAFLRNTSSWLPLSYSAWEDVLDAVCIFFYYWLCYLIVISLDNGSRPARWRIYVGDSPSWGGKQP